MFLKISGISVRLAVKLSPFLEPFAILTSIVFILNSHAVFMCLTKLVWYSYMANHVLMILRPIMHQNSTLVRRWWPGRSSNTLGRMMTDFLTSSYSCEA